MWHGYEPFMKIHPLITDTATLSALIERMSHSPFVALDTEFMRENTYWPDLCLFQIADAEEAAAIDPKAPGLDLTPLLDLMVDNYTPMLTELHGELEEIEEVVLSKASSENFVSELLQVRKDFTRLRHLIRPQREIIDRLARGDSKMIRTTLLPYFRDLRDNLARIEETAIGYHERLMMAFDIYLNKAAFEANEGIKFLTALTAITLPMVMVGGWYGMNFDHMPELRSPHGYLYAGIFTLVTTALMAIYLKKKKWF